MHVGVGVWVRVCARTCVHVRMCACVGVWVWVAKPSKKLCRRVLHACNDVNHSHYGTHEATTTRLANVFVLLFVLYLVFSYVNTCTYPIMLHHVVAIYLLQEIDDLKGRCPTEDKLKVSKPQIM